MKAKKVQKFSVTARQVILYLGDVKEGEKHTFEPNGRYGAVTGTDATAIWEWGFVERVSTGLLCTKHEMQPGATRMLAIADAWAQ